MLVSNSNPDSRFCPGCAEQAQNRFLNLLKIKSPQQANPGKLSWNVAEYSALRYLGAIFDKYILSISPILAGADPVGTKDS